VGDASEGVTDGLGCASIDALQLHPKRTRLRLEGAGHLAVAGAIRISEDRYLGDRRRRVLEQLQAFARQFQIAEDLPSDIAAGPRQAGHNAQVRQIVSGHDHNGDRGGGLPGREYSRRGIGDKDVRLALDQLGRQSGQPVPLVRGIAVLQENGLSLHIAEVTQALPEGIKDAGLQIAGVRGVRGVIRPEHADQRDRLPWLRLGSGQRPKKTKGEGDDEPTVRHHMDVSSWDCLE
jgi:hypothetical protein